MKTIIGIMGPGSDDAAVDIANATAFAKQVAEHGWVVLTGGRPAGVMRAAHEGARAGGGLVVGILPFKRPAAGEDNAEQGETACEFVDIPIYTGLGDARNAITGQSPDVVVAFVGNAGAGTISEVALACKAGRPIVLVGPPESTARLTAILSSKHLYEAADAAAAIRRVELLVQAGASL